jgi:hypothetical protein
VWGTADFGLKLEFEDFGLRIRHFLCIIFENSTADLKQQIQGEERRWFMHYGAAWCTVTIQIQIISVTDQGKWRRKRRLLNRPWPPSLHLLIPVRSQF